MSVAQVPDVNRISRFVHSSDQLRLHYLEYGARSDSGTPIVCLPGLTRNAEDFDRLARVLAAPSGGGRSRVLALDYRGRGRSDWSDPALYTLQQEQEDILAVLAAAEVTNAIFIGTSRGGLHIMALTLAHTSLLRGAVLNDIGPVVEMAGLLRIKSYIGNPPDSHSWEDAIVFLRQSACRHFAGVSDADWETYAHQTYAEEQGRFLLRYDPKLKHTLDALTPENPLPPMWPLFEALKDIPVLGIRGENSDILSPATFAEMAARHSRFESVTVAGQGHAPLLLDQPTISAVAEFVGRCSSEAATC